VPIYIPETRFRRPVLEDGTMDIRRLEELRPRLDGFLARFDDCIRTAPSRRHLSTYVNGQLGPLERKSVEPIALDAGVPPRTLQEFLEIHRWDEQKTARRVREIVMERHADPEAVGIIDETSFAKKGEETAGIQRQYCGETGKLDNCVVTVHLAYATEGFAALVDSDLFLPEETWSQDPERRLKAGIPEGLRHRPKWKIALDMLDRSLADGLRMRWLTADEEYGRVAEFRHETADDGLLYVVEVPVSMTGWTAAMHARGADARRVDALWERGGPSWETYHVKNTEKGPVVGEVRAARFRPHEGRGGGEEQWLLVARNVVTREVKYFFSNAPADVRREEMIRVAFTRSEVEHLFHEAKGEVGLRHFEVRRYKPVMRHLALSMVSLLFFCEEVARLRKKKSVVEHLRGAERRRRAG
jgi:SRSO17 transposase